MFPFRPFRRAYRGLKRLFKRKPKKVVRRRVYKRKARVNGVISVCKIRQQDRDVVNANTYQTGSYTFELSDFPEYASYVELYEYFRIDKVQVSFRSQNNNALSGNQPNFMCSGRVHTVIDYNDAATYAASRIGVSDMMQDNSYRCTTSTRTHTRTLVPKILMEAGGSSLGSVSKGKQWIPTGNTTSNLSHYGLKYILEGGYTNAAGTIPSFVLEPTIKLWVSFKDPQ